MPAFSSPSPSLLLCSFLLALEAVRRNRKEALYISKAAVISWKSLTLCQVWERDKRIAAALSQFTDVFFFLSTKAVYFKLAFVEFILFLHLTHYINSSSINNVSSLLLPQTLHFCF